MILKTLVLLSLVACASKPTPYQKETDKQGYRDQTIDGLRIASFKANSHTKKERTLSYAEFRAIEQCRSENLHANIIDTADKTVAKDVVRTSGSSWGPTYWGMGMYPYYSRYSSIGFSTGFNTINTDSWHETVTYPQVEVYYTCAGKVVRPKLYFKEISPEQMKLLVKDLKGAIQIEKIDESSPNKKTFELGDIIIRADGKRIEKIHELIGQLSSQKPEIKVLIMREGEKIEKRLKTTDVTEEVGKAEIEIINTVCKTKKEDNQKNLPENKLCKNG